MSRLKTNKRSVKSITPCTAYPILSSIIFIHPLFISYASLCMCFSLFPLKAEPNFLYCAQRKAQTALIGVRVSSEAQKQETFCTRWLQEAILTKMQSVFMDDGSRFILRYIKEAFFLLLICCLCLCWQQNSTSQLRFNKKTVSSLLRKFS